jgi:hypothetical protein
MLSKRSGDDTLPPYKWRWGGIDYSISHLIANYCYPRKWPSSEIRSRVRKDSRIQDTRYFIFQIRATGGHDTTFIISTYTINKVKYNNYFITINHVCLHRLKQREVIQARLS